MGITVDELLCNPFAYRPRQEKIDIVLEGKPRPALENLRSVEMEMHSSLNSKQNNTSKFVIVFDKASYDHVDWLTGCGIRQALFCWPCLLFSLTYKDYWNTFGLKDLNNLRDELMQHEMSLLHIQSVLDLQLFFSTIKMDEPPPPPPLENAEIERDREIAKRIIDVICYLVTQQKAGRMGFRNKNSLEVEDCLEHFHFLRDYDVLQTILIDDVIEGVQKTPKIIANMIEAITSTARKEIQKEVHRSTYVSLILSEHSAERSTSQISTVLRYLRSGNVCERFVCFTNEVGLKTSNMIYQLINSVIDDFQIHRKAIAYSLDGSVLDSLPALYELKQELKCCHPHINFVPCHFHNLDDVLLKSLSFFSQCDLFFKNISVVGSHFREGSNACLKFNDSENFGNNKPDEMLNYHNFQPTVVKCCINYAAYLNVIKTYRFCIMDSFDKALAANEKLTANDVVELKAARAFLGDFKNVFYLETLLKLFDVAAPLVETFKSSFPGLVFDANLIECVLKSFDDELRNGVDPSFGKKTVQEFCKLHTDDKHSHSFFRRKKCCKFVLEVAQRMKNQIKYRFEDASKFSFCQILDLESSAKSLNPDHVQALVTNFGNDFDYAVLDKEIKLLVGNSKSIHKLYKFFVTCGLGNSFPNLNKLCELVLTLPSTIPNDRSRSTRTKLDDINLWSKAANKQHARDVTFLCVEQEYLKELRIKKSFYDDVISEFRKINKTQELI